MEYLTKLLADKELSANKELPKQDQTALSHKISLDTERNSIGPSGLDLFIIVPRTFIT